MQGPSYSTGDFCYMHDASENNLMLLERGTRACLKPLDMAAMHVRHKKRGQATLLLACWCSL
jgi:hypothetical protein